MPIPPLRSILVKIEDSPIKRSSILTWEHINLHGEYDCLILPFIQVLFVFLPVLATPHPTPYYPQGLRWYSRLRSLVPSLCLSVASQRFFQLLEANGCRPAGYSVGFQTVPILQIASS